MKKTKGIILALLSSGTFGLIAFFSIPLLKAGVHTPSILFYRSLLAAILLGTICLIRKKDFRIPPKTAIQLFVMGMLYTITAMGLIYSYTYISSGVSTTLHFLYPIVVSCLMIIFYKEKKSLTLFIAAVTSLVGVGLLCWSDNGFISTRGLFIVLITVFTYAVYIVNLGRPVFKKLEPEVLMFYVMLFGAFMFSIYASFTTGIEILPDRNAWLNIVGLVLFATVLSGLSLITAVKYAGSTITSILGSMEPVVATIVGIFYFHESFGWNSFAGLVLIIASVVLVVMMNNKREKKGQIITD
ncbi:DMT family transporter [Dysgonomonas sp. ZJ709]|uniref:DMT family transporter n=1 Tax=Dysgonomonas sp. ZJ709 TaxID=2709797 RepID=UPI0013EB25C6|nr:DMT family transporter [Dysgonomonas sp. ZJ709]